jgi:PAS domain S-box-containing protein
MTEPLVSTPTRAFDFLSGGGEMGDMIRAFDWAKTSIGSIQDWPQSLRTVIDIMLHSQSPIFLWWGTDLIQFYNDAYRPILGRNKHPAALGDSGRHTWVEIWHVINPMIEAVMARGESTRVQDGLLVLERNGFAEEGYFDYAFSPVRNESGRVAGIFVACGETTQRVLAERRIASLRTLAADCAEASSVTEVCRAAALTLAQNIHDVPFALLYLPGPTGAMQLAAATGVSMADRATHTEHWPLEEAQNGGDAPIILEDLAQRLPKQSVLSRLTSNQSPWKAAVLATSNQSKGSTVRAAAVIVLGINPRLLYDEPYRVYQSMVAGQIAANLASALASAQMRQRNAVLALLAESEGRYRSALRAGRMATWETDLVARTRQWSDEAIALFGFDPNIRVGTVGGRSDEYWSAIHPDDRHLVAEFHQLADRQDLFDAEYRIVHPGGAVLWLAGRGKVISRGADGKAQRLINIVADISERKNAERALRDSEERYRGTFENAAIGIAHVGLDGRWLKVNQAICQITGYAAEELERISFTDITHPDDVQLDLSLVAQLLAGEIVNYAMEKRYLRKDGSVVWAHLTVSLLRDADGKPLHFISAIEDISRKKVSEEELNRQRHFIERLTHLMPSVLYVFDLVKQRNIWVNRPASPDEGQRNPDDLDLEADFLNAVDPEDQQRLADHFSRLAVCQDGEVLECTYRVRRRDGQRRWLRSSHAPFARAPNGRVREIVGVATDVTHARQIENTLRDADQKKDNFIATLAHELRNPLAPIRNAVDVMRRVGAVDPKLNWCRDLIDRQVAQMAHLVEDLLDVSRINNGKLTLRTERLEMATVIEQAIETARPYIDAAGHELILELPSPPIVLDGDLTRLAQVFSNLLINAAKYTDGKGTIRLRVEAMHDAVVVRVHDTGIGIAPEHLPNVFDMFGQVTSALARSQGGLGIGLSLIKGLVEMHGGQITALSEGVGTGSEFVVRLPRPSEYPNSGTVATSRSGESTINSTYRILIADDSRDSADSLAMLLQMAGHEVRIAYDGEAALQLAEQYRPDAMLLDIGMPRFNGYQVSQQIRSQPWGKSMILIAQTGWGQDRDRELSRSAGFDHHLVKPVDPSVLETLLHSLVNAAKK